MESEITWNILDLNNMYYIWSYIELWLDICEVYYQWVEIFGYDQLLCNVILTLILAMLISGVTIGHMGLCLL